VSKSATPKKRKVIKDTAKERARDIAQAACDTKAENLTVLDLKKISGFTDYFVIATGTSDRQVQAICDNIHKSLKKMTVYPLVIEGYQEGHWILMDYGSVIVHIFYEETRNFYSLEKLWADAPRIKFRLT